MRTGWKPFLSQIIVLQASAWPLWTPAAAAPLPVVSRVEFQPLISHAQRVAETLEVLGASLSSAEKGALKSAKTVEDIQKVFDPHCLIALRVTPELRVAASPGAAAPVLDEHGWKPYLIKIINDGGSASALKVRSPNADPMYRKSGGAYRADPVLANKKDGPPRWLDVALHDAPPMKPELSGLEVEYKILQIFAADRKLDAKAAVPAAGPYKREAKFFFDLSRGASDVLGAPSEIAITFTSNPAIAVALHILDDGGAPVMASLTFRDKAGHVFPAQSKRLAPDFFFHPQVYRQDGETVILPPGNYNVEATRGPEYIPQKYELAIPAGSRAANLKVQLKRWINPAQAGWISGDHHIHAAGCAHYEDPTQGVLAKDMWRNLLGEDLRVGCALTWGPCYYYQRQFFTGKPDKISTKDYVIRYDMEISGWGSAPSEHIVLLRLKNQDYPGATVLEDWPHLGLLALKWAKAQGAYTGPAHSGWGLAVPATELPNDTVPPCDAIGANEFIMQVTHEVPGPDGKLVPAIDFFSAGDTPYVWELNMWYHALDNGFRPRISGETDFPCIFGDRVGMGRSYVKLEGAPANVDYDKWVANVAAGRSYVSDGKSHLMNFQVAGRDVGVAGSEAHLAKAGTVVAKVNVAALLGEKPNVELQKRPYAEKPYWDIERSRIGASREVALELVVNGHPVATRKIMADGTARDVEFKDVRIDRSSWVAARILPSSHTNPVFVLVEGKPVRASRKSVEWALKTVDTCWQRKRGGYKAEEQETARTAYDHARTTYRRILGETTAE